MRRLFLVIAASMALSGCASFSSDMFSMSMFKSTPPPINVQLESVPPGADAVTSLGPGCKTPCSVSIPAANTFSVTFSMPRFQPVTVPVSVIVNPGDFTTPASTIIDPNPIIAELPPAVPPRRVVKRPPPAKRAAVVARPTAAGPAVASPTSGSPFPAPTR